MELAPVIVPIAVQPLLFLMKKNESVHLSVRLPDTAVILDFVIGQYVMM